MNQLTPSQKLSYRVAAEAQLLAEEKWILEALAKIRIQRNCLQIERLELENMRAKLIKEMNAKKRNENNNTSEVPNAPTAEQQSPMQSTRPEEFDLEAYLKEMETMCNDEKLDLKVSTPVYNKNINSDLDMEETEEEEVEDLEDQDIIVDMNMLMNGQT